MTNLEIIQNLYDHLKKHEFDNVRALFHKNIKWKQMKGFPNSATYVGADEVIKNVFNVFLDNWTGWEYVVHEFLETGEDILAVGKYRGTFKISGKQLDAEFIHRYNLNTGVITHLKEYTDTGQFFATMKGAKQKIQENNPLHGVKLAEILEYLLAEYGWFGLADRVDINCFKSNQTVKSSLNFLRKFEWARKEVEELYLKTLENNS
jgi:ketosteroid isomerase-like protein